MVEVRPIDPVRVWSRNQASIAGFGDKIKQDFPHLTVEGAESPRAVFETADIVCTLPPHATRSHRARGSVPVSTSMP